MSIIAGVQAMLCLSYTAQSAQRAHTAFHNMLIGPFPRRNNQITSYQGRFPGPSVFRRRLNTLASSPSNLHRIYLQMVTYQLS